MHKFTAGQTVDFSSSQLTQAEQGTYSVLLLVPEGKDGPHYRIKSKHEHHEHHKDQERIAHERDLTASSVFAS